MKNILEVQNLQVTFRTRAGLVKAVDDVSFTVGQGEIVAIVGESGSGKSVTSLAVMGLIGNPGQITGGSIKFDGEDLLKKSENEMRRIRGGKLSMIFQDPMTSLNPVLTIGEQIMESLRHHMGLDGAKARERAAELLSLVGIPNPNDRLKQYPHEFSGGMRQRVMIAMALACDPKLLIADEPTTALDVTIQAQIMELLKKLQKQLGMAIILITHDLGVVAGMADRVIVMYGGKVAESGPVRQIYGQPVHPYTWGLLKSVPRLDASEKKRLMPIVGQPPDLLKPPPGCRFAPRCPYAMKVCDIQGPPLQPVGLDHMAACWLTHPAAPKINYTAAAHQAPAKEEA
jgi:oligopeptide transport system ATP-binding protein